MEELKQHALPMSGSTKRNSSSTDNIEREVKKLKTDLEKVDQKTRPRNKAFKLHFDIPSLPSNLMFDFESFDDDNRVSTPKTILLNSVLHIGFWGSWQGASELGTYGIAGLGKITTLKAICSAGSVQGMFVYEVCFMEFAENAALQKVCEEICRCVRKFGGNELAK